MGMKEVEKKAKEGMKKKEREDDVKLPQIVSDPEEACVLDQPLQKTAFLKIKDEEEEERKSKEEEGKRMGMKEVEKKAKEGMKKKKLKAGRRVKTKKGIVVGEEKKRKHQSSIKDLFERMKRKAVEKDELEGREIVDKEKIGVKRKLGEEKDDESGRKLVKKPKVKVEVTTTSGSEKSISMKTKITASMKSRQLGKRKQMKMREEEAKRDRGLRGLRDIREAFGAKRGKGGLAGAEMDKELVEDEDLGLPWETRIR